MTRRYRLLYMVLMVVAIRHWIHVLACGVKPFDWLMFIVEFLVLALILIEFIWHLSAWLTGKREQQRGELLINANIALLLTRIIHQRT